jgi:hypothetical protein
MNTKNTEEYHGNSWYLQLPLYSNYSPAVSRMLHLIHSLQDTATHISNYHCILIILLQYLGCCIFSSRPKTQQHLPPITTVF